MKKEFFASFKKQEKSVSKSISLEKSDWLLFDAYKLYGAAKTGYEIPQHELLREMIFRQINNDKEFTKTKDRWVKQLKEIEEVAQA